MRRERSRLRREPAGLIRTCRRRFPEARIVVTLSRSRSVLLALKAPPAGRRPGRIVVLESLPGGEGRLFAKDLDIAGLSARCIADRAGPDAVAASDLLIVGADAVFADGSVVHKVGTRILAETARRAGVPVVVVAGSSKFTGRYRPRRALPLRFDLTPPRFITEFWTDRGVRTFASQRRPRRAAL
ncbi:MAG TPA: hypothetical protein VK423_03685 [Thermoplasmata archaeon]|nr:hypothetical protein [Thermoplasmata archaeon]